MLSEHFHRSEFECKCGCGFDTIDAETLEVLEELREHFETPIVINSASRCIEHNKAVGGSPESQHLVSRAVDIRVINVLPSVVADYLDSLYPDKYGIGRYTTFTHLDTKSGHKRRWE